jgi:hypothetical protein
MNASEFYTNNKLLKNALTGFIDDSHLIKWIPNNIPMTSRG